MTYLWDAKAAREARGPVNLLVAESVMRALDRSAVAHGRGRSAEARRLLRKVLIDEGHELPPDDIGRRARSGTRRRSQKYDGAGQDNPSAVKTGDGATDDGAPE